MCMWYRYRNYHCQCVNIKGLNRCLGGGPNQNGVEIVVPAPFGYNTSNMLNLPSSQYCMRMYKRTEILSLFLVHLKVDEKKTDTPVESGPRNWESQFFFRYGTRDTYSGVLLFEYKSTEMYEEYLGTTKKRTEDFQHSQFFSLGGWYEHLPKSSHRKRYDSVLGTFW